MTKEKKNDTYMGVCVLQGNPRQLFLHCRHMLSSCQCNDNDSIAGVQCNMMTVRTRSKVGSTGMLTCEMRHSPPAAIRVTGCQQPNQEPMQ
jgi:hypothetical protein